MLLLLLHFMFIRIVNNLTCKFDNSWQLVEQCDTIQFKEEASAVCMGRPPVPDFYQPKKVKRRPVSTPFDLSSGQIAVEKGRRRASNVALLATHPIVEAVVEIDRV